MKKSLLLSRLILAGALCSHGGAGVLRAESPRTPGNLSGPSASEACVLLGNGNVIFGAAHQVGEYVVIRKGGGSEVRLPRSSVACWAGSVRDLYQYRIDHRETENVNVHLVEADWCLQYDLFDLAKRELDRARVLDPGHPEIARLSVRLDRMTSDVSRSVPVVANIKHAHHNETPTLPSSVSQASLEQFARTVQSTLITRCSRCHDSASERAWTISAPPGTTRASAGTTHANLIASLPFVDAADYRNSDLLLKAISAHGGQPAPLGLRHRKAAIALESWLRRAAFEMNQDGERVSEVAQTSANETMTDPSTEFESPPANLEAAEIETAKRPVIEPTRNADLPWRMPRVENPFDPELFNRQNLR